MDELNQQTPIPQATQAPNQMNSSFEDSNGSGSKIIPFIIVVVLFVLVGFGSYVLGTKNSQPPIQKIVSQPSPTPTPDPTANWKTYTNDEIGISFQYPSDWTSLQKNEEPCLLNGDFNREYNNQPCVHIFLISPLNNGFFATQSKLFAQYGPGRGAYWGDRFSFETKTTDISPEEFINTYCTKNKTYICNKQTNTNGVIYIKSLNDEQVIESKRKALYYFVLNKNKNFPVILLSNQDFLDSLGLDKSEKILDQILSTFKFTP